MSSHCIDRTDRPVTPPAYPVRVSPLTPCSQTAPRTMAHLLARTAQTLGAVTVALGCAATAAQDAKPRAAKPTGPGLQAPAAPTHGGGLALPSSLTTPPPITTKDFIVAIVNKELVTNNEVIARLQRIEHDAAQAGERLPPRDVLMEKVLDLLINERAQLTFARDSGVKIDEAEVDRAVHNIAEQNRMTISELAQQLRTEGLDLKRLRGTLRDQLMVERLRTSELQTRVKLTEREVEEEFERQQNLSETRYNIAHLLVAVTDNNKPAEVEQAAHRAQSLLERARSGTDFATLVSKYSDAERNQGGSLGWRATDQLPEPFVTAVKDLKAGEVAPQPLRSGSGFHLLKLIERQTIQGLPATQIHSHARHILLTANSLAEAEKARQTLKNLKRQIDKGSADFATLARQQSQDGSAAQGGDLGWAAPGQFVPEFETALEGLRPGQVSEPVVSRFGVHLIQLLERKSVTLSHEQHLDTARKALKARKQEQAYADWAQEIRARAYVERRASPMGL